MYYLVPFVHQITLEVRVARLYSSQILVTFLPCILLQIIGLSVFAVPVDDLSNRLTVSISCLIVMAALFTQVTKLEGVITFLSPELEKNLHLIAYVIKSDH